jgi:hypothetical protein
VTAASALADALAHATGRVHRDDPALPATGGPAGNAQLTAWIGLVLLIAFIAELVTLLDVTALISWHIAIGVLLVPPALAKTATTSWRILRYYAGSRPYRQAGPPPLLLRLLGPLVVVTTLAVLGSGLALIALGPESTSTALTVVAGQRISPLTIHQAAFIAWAVATGLHVIARIVPAVRLTLTPAGSVRLAGMSGRTLTLLATVAIAAITAVLVLQLATSWTVR